MKTKIQTHTPRDFGPLWSARLVYALAMLKLVEVDLPVADWPRDPPRPVRRDPTRWN